MGKTFRRKGELILMYYNGKHVGTYKIGNETYGGSMEFRDALRKEIKRRLRR